MMSKMRVFQIGLVCLLNLGPLLGCQHTTRETRSPPSPQQPVINNEQNRVVNTGRDDIQEGQGQLLQGDRAVIGTVEAITGDQIKVNIGEVHPRFLPLRAARERGLATIKPGDQLMIVLNGDNLVVDYHPPDQTITEHRIIQGQIAQNLTIGHDTAVIRRLNGQEETLEIRPAARSKVASIPVGVESLFLIDEMNKIVDATFASVEDARQAGQQGERKSPLKGAHRQVEGIVVEPLRSGLITIQMEENVERSYEIRAPIEDKVAKLEKGQAVTLLVDTEDKVMDVAVAP